MIISWVGIIRQAMMLNDVVTKKKKYYASK